MSDYKSELSGRRIVFRKKFYTEEERQKIKEQYMKDAEAWEAPHSYDEAVYLEPGDPGYNEAPYHEELIWIGAGGQLPELPQDTSIQTYMLKGGK